MSSKKPLSPKAKAAQAREKADAALRKAAQAARIESLEWLDRLREDPDCIDALQHEMCEDLQRVYNTPHSVLGRTAGRDRYRELGHFSETLVKAAFGTHGNFKIEAGLADTPTERKGAARAAKLQQEQKIHKYYKEVIEPFAMDPFVDFGTEGVTRLVVSSDHHSQRLDPFAMRVLRDFVEWVQPDMNVINGDAHEFQEFSTHPKFPGHFDFSAQDEVDFCVENIYLPLKMAAPNARHVWVMGNHDYRYVRYLADNATALASFRSMNLIEQFRLDEVGYDLVCRSNFLAPTSKMRKRDIAENWMVVDDCFVITHGVFTSNNANAQHYKKFLMSGTNGHLHKPNQGQSFFNGLNRPPCCWTTTPMMAGFAVGRDYVGMPSEWQMGFVYVTIDRATKEVTQHIITVGDTATFGNRTWRITDEEREIRRRQWEV